METESLESDPDLSRGIHRDRLKLFDGQDLESAYVRKPSQDFCNAGRRQIWSIPLS
jgi:hypothetical protein